MARIGMVIALLLSAVGFAANISFEITGGEGKKGDLVSSDVLVSSDTDLQGWSWGIRYDGDALVAVDAQNGPLLATAKDGEPADFQELALVPEDELSPGVTQGIVIDILTQILLPPVQDYVSATVTFEVILDLEPGVEPVETEVVFADDVGDPEIATVAVVGGLSIEPDPKTPGTITIIAPGIDCAVENLVCTSDPDNVFLSWGYNESCEGERPFEFLLLYRRKQPATEWERLAVWDIEDLVEFPTSYDDLMLEPGIYEYSLSWVYWPAAGGPLAIDEVTCEEEVIALLISDVSLDTAFLPGVVKDPVSGLVPAEIVLTGRGFTTIELTTLKIGDKEVEITDITPDTEMRGLVPCSSELGTFDLYLENDRGEVLIEDAFTYGWMRGDVRIDGILDLQDAIDILGYLFNLEGAVEPYCLDAADLNDDGFLDITDAIFMVYFLSGIDPVVYTPGEPFETPDPTPGGLGCALEGFDCENSNP